MRTVSRERLDEWVERQAGGGRDRVYPPLRTLGLFVEQVMSSDQSCQDAVGRGLSARTALGMAPTSLNTGPYCKARQRLPWALIQGVAQEVAASAQRAVPPHWLWQGRVVKLIDGTTMSMPDTAANQEAFPQNRQQKPGLGFPVARLVGVVDLASGCATHWTISACEGKGTHELLQLWQLREAFAPGDILIADRAYCSYFLLADLQQRGIDCVIREHSSRKTDLKRALPLGHEDHLLTWRKPQRPDWMAPATYAAIPAQLNVRQVRDRGWRIITTLTDPRAVHTHQIAWLYRQRWHIELDFRSIKCTMRMNILRCKTPHMIKNEIGAHLLGYNLIRVAMTHAAAHNPWSPRQLSFAAARRALAFFQLHLIHLPDAPFASLFYVLLGHIAQARLPHRPDRAQPRAIKRRPSTHPLLKAPRGDMKIVRYVDRGLR